MKRFFLWPVAALLGAASFITSVEPAKAHVVYGNPLFSDPTVIDPLTNASGVGSTFSNQDRTVSGNGGWAAALSDTTWGDSHNVRMMYFHLAQPSTISFTITGTSNSNGASLLNPGYSIYSGHVPNVSHDGGFYPGQTPFAPWSPFHDSAVGSDPASQKWGEFRANGDVTMAAYPAGSTTPVISTMHYLGLSGSNPTGNTITGTYDLGPGLYTLVVGGANPDDAARLLAKTQAMTHEDWVSNRCSPHPCTPTNPTETALAYRAERLTRNFNIQFHVHPVPIPAAAWLFGSALAGIAALARRRNS